MDKFIFHSEPRSIFDKIKYSQNVEYFTFYRRVCCNGCRSFGNKSFLSERRSFPEFAHQRQPAFTKKRNRLCRIDRCPRTEKMIW